MDGSKRTKLGIARRKEFRSGVRANRRGKKWLRKLNRRIENPRRGYGKTVWRLDYA